MCAQLSNYMYPDYKMTDSGRLDEFDGAIAELERLAEALTFEARRLSN